MRMEWKSEWPFWVVLAAMLLLGAVTWPSAPERIPVHWDLTGQPDRYGGRVQGLLAVPGLALLVYVAMLLAPRFDPGRANYPRFWGVYTALRLAVLLVLALAYGVIHLWIRGLAVDVGLLVGGAVGLLFLLVGSVLGKVRPTWFVGIRTPWTLSSKRAWIKTHRLGGWLFLLMGAAVILAAVVQTEAVLSLALALSLGSLAVLTVYSYVVWRADPDRIPPAGTLPAEEG